MMHCLSDWTQPTLQDVEEPKKLNTSMFHLWLAVIQGAFVRVNVSYSKTCVDTGKRTPQN
jgi:hypothetical protein